MKNRTFLLFVTAAAVACADTLTWTGGAGDGKWSSAGNWSSTGSHAVPQSGDAQHRDDVHFEGPGVVTVGACATVLYFR